MQQYVAFDVSKQSSEAVIVDAAGRRLVSRKVATDPVAMAAFVARHGRNVVAVGFEAGRSASRLGRCRPGSITS